jgi:biopolymer transport protein ExbD
MRSKWRKRRHAETPEMDITAFMNLMVVLVPFLLITAVFSRLAIIELDLPAASSVAVEEPSFQLEVTIREDGLEVGERNQGLLTRLPRTDGHHDLDGLADYLQRVKSNYPDMSNATVLLEPDVPYDTLVQVMDVLRSREVREGRQLVRAELFPDISIGDAPVSGPATGKGS